MVSKSHTKDPPDEQNEEQTDGGTPGPDSVIPDEVPLPPLPEGYHWPAPKHEDEVSQEQHDENAKKARRDIVQLVGLLTVVVFLCLVVAQSTGVVSLDDSTLRLVLTGGIILSGGTEVIRLVAESFAG